MSGTGRRPVVAVSPLPSMLEPLAGLYERAGCEVRRLSSAAGLADVDDRCPGRVATARRESDELLPVLVAELGQDVVLQKVTLPTKLKQAIDANDATTEAQRSLVANQKAEMVRIDTNYDAELERLRKLWAGAQPGSLGPLATEPPAAENAAPDVRFLCEK